MTLNVRSHPEFLELASKIAEWRGNKKLDEFFWLKAVRRGNNSFDLFRGQAPADHTEVFRIANIVLQGGGVLGLAHAGFVTGLELASVRFAGIAGASAGAIMAMGMAAVRGDDLLEKTHEKVIKIVGDMPMSTFIDGPYTTRRLIKQILLKRYSYRPSAWMAWLGAFRQILRKRGLNPGNAFEDWLRGVFNEYGVRTVDDLMVKLDTIGGRLREQTKKHRPDSAAKPGAGRDKKLIVLTEWELDDGTGAGLGENLLQVMAACSPLGVKFQFPRDVKYLAASNRMNSPAALVRASMSIPLFFEPATFDVSKSAWPAFVHDRLFEFMDTPRLDELKAVSEVAFLDGGIFSNLPVDAFSTVLPDVPTVAVPLMNATLAKPYQRRARLKSLFTDIGTVGFMVRNQRDRDAVEHLRRAGARFRERRDRADPVTRALMPERHPFVMAPINVGSANWLNFVMDETDMTELFLSGLRRAHELLKQLCTEEQANGNV